MCEKRQSVFFPSQHQDKNVYSIPFLLLIFLRHFVYKYNKRSHFILLLLHTHLQWVLPLECFFVLLLFLFHDSLSLTRDSRVGMDVEHGQLTSGFTTKENDSSYCNHLLPIVLKEKASQGSHTPSMLESWWIQSCAGPMKTTRALVSLWL